MSKDISKELRAFREQRGLTRADAASLIGVSRRSIEHWENGRPCSVADLVRGILKHLEYSHGVD
jgi:DNA-binding XRE family transcriptional regulator